MAIEVFISYYREDQAYLDRLKQTLVGYDTTIATTCWAGTGVPPGTERMSDLKAALASARLGILLVTPGFLASEFINEHERPALLRRALEGTLTLVPIPVRPVDWLAQDFSTYQSILDPEKPLANLSRAGRDKAYVKIGRFIKGQLTAIKPKSELVPHHYHPPPQLFVGREGELATLSEGLARPGVQIIYQLQGAGGVGKTTLARELLHRHGADFAAVVELRAGERSPQELATALAAALGQRSDEPRSPEEARATISGLLRAQRVLLLLDNVEDASKLAYTLPQGGQSAILITSRDADLEEALVQLRPDLAPHTVPLTFFSQAENRALFRAVLRKKYLETDEPDYDAIGTLLGFLPVALRLALNWLAFPPHLSAAELRAKLERETALPTMTKNKGPDPELRTLAAVFDLNAPTLDPAARQALALLAHCAPDPVPLTFLNRMTDTDPETLLETLEHLARHHWCSATARSYELHILLRTLVRAAQPDPSLRERFLTAVHTLYHQAPETEFALKDSCLPQLQEALALWQHQPDARLADLVYAPFRQFCERRGHGALFLTLATKALKAFPANKRLQAAGLSNQAVILQNWGRLEEAMALLHQQQSLCEELGDRVGLSHSYGNQALILKAWGLLEESRALLDKVQALCEELGDRASLSITYGNQALILKTRGRLEEAMALHLKEQTLKEELGDRAGLSASYGNQAQILKAWGRLEEAMALLHKQQALKEELGDRAGLTITWWYLGVVLEAQGQPDAALALYRKAVAQRQELGLALAADFDWLAQLAAAEKRLKERGSLP